MAEYRTVPTFTQRLTARDGSTSTPWYRLLQGLHTGAPPAAESTVTVSGSPFCYAAPSGGFAIVTGGSVSPITFTRASQHNTNQTSGVFPLSQGDVLTITSSVAPNVIFVPT